MIAECVTLPTTVRSPKVAQVDIPTLFGYSVSHNHERAGAA